MASIDGLFVIVLGFVFALIMLWQYIITRLPRADIVACSRYDVPPLIPLEEEGVLF